MSRELEDVEKRYDGKGTIEHINGVEIVAVDRADLNYLIEQAKIVKKLENKYQELDLSYGGLKAMHNNLIHRQAILENEHQKLNLTYEGLKSEYNGLYRRYRKAIGRNIKNKRNYYEYKDAIRFASEELELVLTQNKSDDVKKFYVENAKRKLDEILEGDSHE